MCAHAAQARIGIIVIFAGLFHWSCLDMYFWYFYELILWNWKSENPKPIISRSPWINLFWKLKMNICFNSSILSFISFTHQRPPCLVKDGNSKQGCTGQGSLENFRGRGSHFPRGRSRAGRASLILRSEIGEFDFRLVGGFLIPNAILA